MPDAQTTIPEEAIHEEEPRWAQEREELPPRPRRRLLGAGANPVPVALLGVLLIACGFIGGVLVEKGQTSSSTSGSGASGLAARFAGLRSAAGGSTTAGSTAAGAGASAGGGFPRGFAGRFGGAGGGGATIGEVSYIQGNTLYVTNAEGNTVKVTTSAASTVTKTVSTTVHGIHPGDTVVVRGAKGSSGAISAESVSVNTGAAAGLGGGGAGLSSLFGGSSRAGG